MATQVFSAVFGITGIIFLCATTMTSAYAGQDMSRAAIAKRIQPVGQVNIAGEQAVTAPVNADQAAVASAAPAVDGQAIYDQYCAMCHAAGLAGAPKIGDSADWQPRMDKGMDVMLAHVENGFNAMPMKGTCMSCDQDQLRAAIEYMLPR